MKYLLFILLLLTSCRTARLEYDPETVYLIVQSPKYNLYLPKNDMVNILERVYISGNAEKRNYDCIKKLCQTDSIITDADYILDKSNYLEKMDEADAFYSCAIELFKQHKVLVYDKIRDKWIVRYRIRHRVYLDGIENNSFYEVLYNDSLIYDSRE